MNHARKAKKDLALAGRYRAAGLGTRSIKTTSKAWAIDTAISMIDLTTLEGQDTPGKVRALCAKALRPDPSDPAPILLVLSTTTWHAYNDWGGSNHYQGLCGPSGGDFAAEHFADEFEPRQSGGGVFADEGTVAQDRDAVGDGVDLIEKVGDQQDRKTLRFQIAKNLKEFSNFVRVKA